MAGEKNELMMRQGNKSKLCVTKFFFRRCACLILGVFAHRPYEIDPGLHQEQRTELGCVANWTIFFYGIQGYFECVVCNRVFEVNTRRFEPSSL